MNYAVAHYLDASVACKLLIKEDDSGEIRDYVQSNPSYDFWITEYVYYEILNVLKRKWVKKSIDEKDYHSSVLSLNCYIDDDVIQVSSEFDIKENQNYYKLFKIVDRYGIDYSDALQILSVLEGRQKRRVDECKTVLVSADQELVRVAKALGLRVWHYSKEPPPTV